jgi:hypothetical protein
VPVAIAVERTGHEQQHQSDDKQNYADDEVAAEKPQQQSRDNEDKTHGYPFLGLGFFLTVPGLRGLPPLRNGAAFLPPNLGLGLLMDALVEPVVGAVGAVGVAGSSRAENGSRTPENPGNEKVGTARHGNGDAHGYGHAPPRRLSHVYQTRPLGRANRRGPVASSVARGRLEPPPARRSRANLGGTRLQAMDRGFRHAGQRFDLPQRQARLVQRSRPRHRVAYLG